MDTSRKMNSRGNVVQYKTECDYHLFAAFQESLVLTLAHVSSTRTLIASDLIRLSSLWVNFGGSNRIKALALYLMSVPRLVK